MTTVWEQVTANAKLISLPDVYLRLKALMDEQDFGMAEVAVVIGHDSAISARLLRLVNSPYFGFASKIDTVSRAVSMLGVRQVHDLVLATSVASSFENMPTTLMDMHTYWQRSVHCAVVARLLATYCNVLDSERLFLAGLLRDIGHMIMYQTVPDLAAQAMEKAASTEQPLFRVEQELIGLDYARVGGVLMRQWELPKSLRESTEFHVEPGRAQDYPLETAITHLAAQVVEATAAGEAIKQRMHRVDAAAWRITGLEPDRLIACQLETEAEIDRAMEMIFPDKLRASA